jgi:TonB family protein
MDKKLNTDEFYRYREVAKESWFSTLPRQLRQLMDERRNPPPALDITAEPDPTVLEKMVEGPSSFSALWVQIQELRSELKNPTPKAELTASADPAALDGLIEGRSVFLLIYSQILGLIRDFRNPPVIETTAEPVEVAAIWTRRQLKIPAVATLGGHLLAILLIFGGFTFGPVPVVRTTETFIPLYLPADLMMLPEEEDTSGGGGGKETLTAPSLGAPPKASDKQLIPPSAEPPKNLNPILVAEPTVVVPQLASLLNVSLPNLGDSMALPAPPSSGPGSGSGIGIGQGRGVGEGKGPGLGPGEGGGIGGGVFRVGGGITPPSILTKRDPVYSEEARKAQYQGTVVLEAIVRKDGSVEIIRVVRSLGFGLDKNAVKALREWKFRPGMRNGVPVDIALNIEINFNLR